MTAPRLAIEALSAISLRDGNRPILRRVSLAVAVTGLHGFFLGMPFPTGVRIMGQHRQRLIPWGWAMNSYATVIGSVLSVLIAMSLGFSAVYLMAAGAYAIALLASGSLARG